MADAVAALRAAADERARQAEVDRGRAEGRRRATVRAAGVVAAVLLLGVAGTAAGLWRTDAARRRAEVAEMATADQLRETETARQREADQRAAAEAARAEAVTNEKAATATVEFFEKYVFVAGRPKGQKGGLGHDVSLRAAVVAAVPALDQLSEGQPLTAARLRLTLGKTLQDLGDHESAAKQYELSRPIFVKGNNFAKYIDHDFARDITLCYVSLRRFPDILTFRSEFLTAYRRELGPDHPDTLSALLYLSGAYEMVGRWTDCRRSLEECLAARRRVLAADHPQVIECLLELNRITDGRKDSHLKLAEELLEAVAKPLRT